MSQARACVAASLLMALATLPGCRGARVSRTTEGEMLERYRNDAPALAQVVKFVAAHHVVYVSRNAKVSVDPRGLPPSVVRECRDLLGRAHVKYVEQRADGTVALGALGSGWPMQVSWAGFIYVPKGKAIGHQSHFETMPIAGPWHVFWKY